MLPVSLAGLAQPWHDGFGRRFVGDDLRVWMSLDQRHRIVRGDIACHCATEYSAMPLTARAIKPNLACRQNVPHAKCYGHRWNRLAISAGGADGLHYDR